MCNELQSQNEIHITVLNLGEFRWIKVAATLSRNICIDFLHPENRTVRHKMFSFFSLPLSNSVCSSFEKLRCLCKYKHMGLFRK